jgi:phenylpropionate dioxygenase-like ring-hydroxylating dioxygenase large terminal subunit
MTVTSSRLGDEPRAIEDALARGMTFPARWYSDPAVYELELELIFARSWQLVGPLHRVAGPGDFMVGAAGHVPVVIARDRDGELNGFVNVCRHRAYPVAREDGCRKTLQCQYHGWTYELDGRLRRAPRAEREPGFERSDFSLVPVAVDTWDGFVFVNPDPDAGSLRDAFPELDGISAARGVTFAGFDYVDRWHYDIAANWKVWVENATECYHCPTVHAKSFSDAWDVDVDVYEYVNAGGIMAQFTPFNRSAKRYRPDRDGIATDRGFRFVYLWPCSFVAVDDYVAFTGMIVPTGPESCRFSADVYVNPACDQAFLDQWMEMYNRTVAEDTDAVAVQQPGLRSRMVPHGRLMPGSESSIAHFHRLVWEALSPAA